MINNVVKSPKTTFLGLGIILAAAVSVFTNNINWTEAVIGMTFGSGLLFAPDPKKK